MSSSNFISLRVTPDNISEMPEISGNVSFWQSKIWAEILTHTKQAEVILVQNTTHTVLVERRNIWGKYSALYILGVADELITEGFLAYIRGEIMTSRDLFLQIEPIDCVEVQSAKCKVQSDEFFKNSDRAPLSRGVAAGRGVGGNKKSPFRRFIEPVTAILDLKKGEEELMSSFAEKGRYNIRLAQKRGVITKWVKSSELCTVNSKQDELKTQNSLQEPLFQSLRTRQSLERQGMSSPNTKLKTYGEAFYNLLEETTERDGFSHNSLAYYRHFIETLETHNAGGLLIAEKDGVLHAAGIFVYPSGNLSPLLDMPAGISPSEGEGVSSPSGDLGGLRGQGTTGIYYYGASSSDREIRRDMATYLLQWEAIREAMRRGCSEYDFLGISEDGTGKLAGVTEFKLRFNPEKKYFPAERVIIYKPFILKALQIVRSIKKLFR